MLLEDALAGGFRALIEHPEEFDKVRNDLARAPDAVEEILRFEYANDLPSVEHRSTTAAEHELEEWVGKTEQA